MHSAPVSPSQQQKGTPKQEELRAQIAAADPLQIILGAARTSAEGWIATDVHALDITKESDWNLLFGARRATAMMAEHVWEHLTSEQTAMGNLLCFKYLEPGGCLRVAVPDGFKPDPAYIEHVRPGGTGAGAMDHKVLYNYRTFREIFERAGFEVQLLEYWDEDGNFHHRDWTSERGHIRRSRRYDPRNEGGKLGYTSLILDAVKPRPFASLVRSIKRKFFP